MLPKLTYIVKAFDNVEKLDQTIESIAKTNMKHNKYIAIVSTENHFDQIKEIINKEQNVPDRDTYKIFNKFPYGVPTFCLCFGEGKIRESDVINLILNKTRFTEIYSVCNSGDLFHINHPLFILNAIKECYQTVGLVYTDYYDEKLRMYSFPYMKEAFELLNITRYSFPSFMTKNLPNCTEKDFLKLITDKYMAIQIPYPLLRINNE